MNSIKLKSMLNTIGLITHEDKNNVFKGHSMNVLSYPVFRVWVNTKGNTTIKTRGVQKSFNISSVDELKKELVGFEII